MYFLKIANFNPKAKKNKKKLHPPFYRAGFGGGCDCFGSGLQTFALFFVTPSIYCLARNATVIFVALFNVYYLKKKLLRFQILSIVLITIGFLLVAIASIVYSQPADHASSFSFMSFVGILCLLLSLVVQGFTYNYQEKLLSQYEIHPLQMVGMESLVGSIVCTVLFGITSLVTCSHSEFCEVGNGGPIDSPPTAFRALTQNYALVYFLLIAFSVTVFNFVGLVITKYSGAVLRVVLEALRTILIWILSLIIGFESLKPAPKLVIEICGFLLLILGNLIYNKIIVIKKWGLDNFTVNSPNGHPGQNYTEIETKPEIEENSLE